MDGVRQLVCPVLVGRDDLLDLTDRRIAEVVGDGGRFLLLAGEAGVGHGDCGGPRGPPCGRRRGARNQSRGRR